MRLATSDRTLIHAHIKDVDLHGDPEPWQTEVGKNAGSSIIWWDAAEGSDDAIVLRCGTVEG
ncbi:MAG: hypothetical protein ABJX32_21940 [Tateyamaria sp.]|uniref:hypothetical protein n=1 Tax=Tateyamaria sp. TaxID=1929288 RepID=UPI00329D8535